MTVWAEAKTDAENNKKERSFRIVQQYEKEDDGCLTSCLSWQKTTVILMLMII